MADSSGVASGSLLLPLRCPCPRRPACHPRRRPCFNPGRGVRFAISLVSTSLQWLAPVLAGFSSVVPHPWCPNLQAPGSFRNISNSLVLPVCYAAVHRKPETQNRKPPLMRAPVDALQVHALLGQFVERGHFAQAGDHLDDAAGGAIDLLLGIEAPDAEAHGGGGQIV